MSKRPGSSEEVSELPDKKTRKAEMPKVPSSSEKGSKLPDVKKQKNSKYCCFCDLDTTELCPECWNNIHILLRNPCLSRKCSISICDEEFHFHCYQSYISEIYRYTNQIDFFICLYC